MPDKVIVTNEERTKIASIKEQEFNSTSFATALIDVYKLAADPNYSTTTAITSPSSSYKSVLGVSTNAFIEKPPIDNLDTLYYPLDSDLNGWKLSDMFNGFSSLNSTHTPNTRITFNTDSGFSSKCFFSSLGCLSNTLLEENLITPEYNNSVWSPTTITTSAVPITITQGFDGIEVKATDTTQSVYLKYPVTIPTAGYYCFSFWGRVNTRTTVSKEFNSVGFSLSNSLKSNKYVIQSNSKLTNSWNFYSVVANLTAGSYTVGFVLPPTNNNLNLPFRFAGFRVEKRSYPTFEDPRFIVDRDEGIKFPILIDIKQSYGKSLDTFDWVLMYRRYLTFATGYENITDSIGNINIRLSNGKFIINNTEFPIEDSSYSSSCVWETIILTYSSTSRKLALSSVSSHAALNSIEYTLQSTDTFENTLKDVEYNLALGMDTSNNVTTCYYRDVIFIPNTTDYVSYLNRYIGINNEDSPNSNDYFQTSLRTLNIVEGQL